MPQQPEDDAVDKVLKTALKALDDAEEQIPPERRAKLRQRFFEAVKQEEAKGPASQRVIDERGGGQERDR
jgi:DNA-directed RNA polymerase specialized sigma24 family protein